MEKTCLNEVTGPTCGWQAAPASRHFQPYVCSWGTAQYLAPPVYVITKVYHSDKTELHEKINSVVADILVVDLKEQIFWLISFDSGAQKISTKMLSSIYTVHYHWFRSSLLLRGWSHQPLLQS
jgi:hypothetical protein